jgi:peptidoglycan/xylan/chitin deacetylase (PgdA/CDA1 family)
MAERVSVIVYHAVGECTGGEDPYGLFVAEEAFEEQVDFLVRRREIVPLEAAVGGVRCRRPPVAITFDDGYRNNLTVAAPILYKYGVPATVFVATGWLGRRSEWIGIPTVCDDLIMTPDELVQVEALGIRVESHGHAHIDMASAGAATVAHDLQQSKSIIADILGRAPRFLAYPWGRSSFGTREVARDLGFTAAFSIDRPDEGPFARSRMTVNPATGSVAFSLKTSGHFETVRHSPLLSDPIRRLAKAKRRRAGIQT